MKKVAFYKIFLSFIGLFLIWTGVKYLEYRLTFWGEPVSMVAKIIIWGGIAVFLINRNKESLIKDTKELFETKIDIKSLLPLFALIVVTECWLIYQHKANFVLSKAFDLFDVLNVVIITAIIEELFFRGWILRSLETRCSKDVSNAITAILFGLIHIPIWVSTGVIGYDMISTFLLVTMLGYAFGLAFQSKQSLWNPIILHMTWNLLYLTIM
jgi:hypothetical protein